MFALGNAMFACGICSAHERLFEEASGETEVGKRLLAPELCPLLALVPQTRPWHANRTPTWSSDLRGRYFAWNWTIPVVLQRCCQTRARVQVFFTHFTSVLRQQFAGNGRFLREANTYERALALRNLRLDPTWGLEHIDGLHSDWKVIKKRNAHWHCTRNEAEIYDGC